MSPRASTLDSLRSRAEDLLSRAYVPFSETPTAAVLLLDDGRWIPGVRVESASYSLTIPALLNAYTTAVALERSASIAAFVLSRSFRREEALYVEDLPQGPFEPCADDAWVQGAGGGGSLPSMKARHPPSLDASIGEAKEGIQAVRRVAQRAHVPASGYPVGALFDIQDTLCVPGVNVEHPDWARILCAERNALGTVQSYALPTPHRLYLTCRDDPDATPCGACRQLLAELAPEATLWMDRHSAPHERSSVSALLPGSFRGQALLDVS
ncbi:cytidine deaminase [Salinibacter altiplanensis]|uniref:cytidine deaminase n=1 Tax=Salinibacter altiplanensis TaxID=1803181 RepID=UPI001F36D9FC|nr:cytidine deaminase [Salinibacter altiplanensis]